ncbi:methylated-DNA--[protein]-cysteine S-methyltransferase [Algoriphagus confluentis]|uniref:Methylated-DNA--protein-cysteine methyltransferase n=1 Tax=Algoriphagus confluentis TaxID=1697556 RepID=A0ABQ6PSK1_9BACT|nr:methylated-DNA--[protein]-cysteine S-methyltransferase [Algoriphagus confluentis]
MKKILTQTFKTPVGELILGAFENQLCLCDWKYRKMRKSIDSRIQAGLNAEFIEEDSPVFSQTKLQLQEYFDGKRKVFDLPLMLVGTPFQKQVWRALLEIPFGQTASYLELSQQLGNPDAIRAVASANGANAISIVIPCHRIIGSDGSLVGYAGGLEAKKKLLLLEGVKASSAKNQIQLF